MIQRTLRKTVFLAVTFCLSLLLCDQPAFATTYSFQSPGSPGQEGVLTGSVTYDSNAVRKSIEKSASDRGVVGTLTLEELGENSNFSFEYISPHSGVKHSKDTICPRNIYDLDNGLPGNEVIGAKDGPFFDFSNSFDLVAIDFRSCVGEKGNINSFISDRDPEVAFSELESQFNQLKLIESDYSGSKPGRFKKRFSLKFKLEEI